MQSEPGRIPRQRTQFKSRPSRIKIKSSSWFKSWILSQEKDQGIQFSLKTEFESKIKDQVGLEYK
jgi:hypothetical protein